MQGVINMSAAPTVLDIAASIYNDKNEHSIEVLGSTWCK